MWLVLAAAGDPAAHWAFSGLKTRGVTPIEFITAETLVNSLRWEHRLGTNASQTHTTLADGRTVDHATIFGVLNRISYLPKGRLLTGRPADHEYATAEFHAFITSWLYALPEPTLNRATPQGLSGSWRHLSEWLVLAARVGLLTPPYRLSSRTPNESLAYQSSIVPDTTTVRTLFVVGNRVVGLAPEPVRIGCQQLATLAATHLLGIYFTVDAEGGWTFVGADPLVDLRLGGEALLDELVAVLSQRQEVAA